MTSKRKFEKVGHAPTSDRGYRLIQGRVVQVIPPEEAPEYFWGRMADITSGKYTAVIRQDQGSKHSNPVHRAANRFLDFFGPSGDAVIDSPALVAEEFPYEEGDVIRVEADRVLPRWPDVCEPVGDIEEVKA